MTILNDEIYTKTHNSRPDGNPLDYVKLWRCVDRRNGEQYVIKRQTIKDEGGADRSEALRTELCYQFMYESEYICKAVDAYEHG